MILEANDPSNDHVVSYFGLKEAAIARLRKWMAETNLAMGRLHAYIASGSSRGSGLAPERFVVEVCPTGMVLRSQTAHFNVNISMPTEVSVRTKNIGSEYTKEEANAIRKELVEVLSPHPDGSGLWWADADFYPLRPVWEGETKDMENGSKPLPHWTVIDGTTGDEVKKVPVREAAKPKKRNVAHVSAAGKSGMWNAAFERVEGMQETLRAENVYCEAYMMEREGSIGMRPLSGNTAEWSYLFAFDLRDPSRPVITGKNPRLSIRGADPEAHYERLTEMLREALEPHTHGSGAWWADEEMYLQRSAWEGETSATPPHKGWTLVDPASYEPIKESMLHEASSWMDDRWVSQTLETIREEVEALVPLPLRANTIALNQSSVFDLLYSMGLPGDAAQNVSAAWVQVLLARLRKSSKQWLDLVTGDLKGALYTVHSYPQAKVKLVCGRKDDGSFEYDQVACTVVDLAGHIGMTIEKDPSAVWAYDPETYELLNVPTYDDARHNRGEFVARLRDIDEGRV